MSANEKRMLEREALRSVIQQWNANRLDLFELSEPDEVSGTPNAIMPWHFFCLTTGSLI